MSPPPPDDSATLQALTAAGLVNVIHADPDLVVIAAEGDAVGDVVIGRPLCDQLPVLVGLEEDFESLKSSAGRRLEMANVSVVAAAGEASRKDIAAIFDQRTGTYIVTVTPSLGNDPLAVGLEQSLREKYVLEAQIAEQTRAVAAANAALKQTNADLVDFTRIVSHDLKAPMRAMRYTADDLEQAVEARDPVLQAQALDELRFLTRRLSNMVADLLAYARLDDKAEAVSEVDTHALLASIVAALPRPAGLEVAIAGEWPRIVTVKPPLDLVMRNLIDNAIKHHDREVGTIEVIGRLSGNKFEIVVSDDGPGIPAAHRQSVLAPFAKLGGSRDEGTGLGLAFVDKILKQLGGHIEIGPRLDGGRGARLTVLWPLTMASN